MKYLIFLWSNAIDKKKKASKFHDFDNEKIERMCFDPKRSDNKNKYDGNDKIKKFVWCIQITTWFA